MDRSLDAAVEELAAGFSAGFSEVVTGPATVGREAEFPLVDAQGRAGDHERLWPMLVERTGGRPLIDAGTLLVGVETDAWFCLAEVGRGTIEIGIGPRGSLVELREDLGAALAVVSPAAASLGYRLLGLGIQPRTVHGERQLTPKARYRALVQATRGWLPWTVTASDQVHVAIARDEVVPAANAMNGACGAIIALCANSAVLGGRVGAQASSREALSARVTGERYRCGAVPRRFADAEDLVRWTTGFRTLALPDASGGFMLPGVPFAELLRRDGPHLDAWLFHDHYLWPSARPRARLGTIEIRPACQQPGGSFAAAALCVGMVAGWRRLGDLLADVAPDPAGWRRLLAYRARAVREGIRAAEPAPDFLATVVDIAAEGLRARGLGEETMLDPIHERLARRRGPADDARTAFAEGGVPELIEAFALPVPAGTPEVPAATRRPGDGAGRQPRA